MSFLYQRCYTSLLRYEGDIRTGGWTAAAVSRDIPSAAQSACERFQSADASAKNANAKDHTGRNPLRLYEFLCDGQYAYVIRTNYGLRDHVGRPNAFSHAYIAPLDGFALERPQELLWLDASRFDQEASDAERNADPASESKLLAERAEKRLGPDGALIPWSQPEEDAFPFRTEMRKKSYQTLLECVYAHMNEQRETGTRLPPLYVQYEAGKDADESMRRLLCAIFYGLPYCMRRELRASNWCDIENTPKDLMFVTEGARFLSQLNGGRYVVPSTGETSLKGKYLGKAKRCGYLSYAAQKLKAHEFPTFFKALDSKAKALGDADASSEEIRKLVWQCYWDEASKTLTDAPNLGKLSEKDAPRLLSDVTKSGAYSDELGKLVKAVKAKAGKLNSDLTRALSEWEAECEQRNAPPPPQPQPAPPPQPQPAPPPQPQPAPPQAVQQPPQPVQPTTTQYAPPQPVQPTTPQYVPPQAVQQPPQPVQPTQAAPPQTHEPTPVVQQLPPGYANLLQMMERQQKLMERQQEMMERQQAAPQPQQPAPPPVMPTYTPPQTYAPPQAVQTPTQDVPTQTQAVTPPPEPQPPEEPYVPPKLVFIDWDAVERDWRKLPRSTQQKMSAELEKALNEQNSQSAYSIFWNLVNFAPPQQRNIYYLLLADNRVSSNGKIRVVDLIKRYCNAYMENVRGASVENQWQRLSTVCSLCERTKDTEFRTNVHNRARDLFKLPGGRTSSSLENYNLILERLYPYDPDARELHMKEACQYYWSEMELHGSFSFKSLEEYEAFDDGKSHFFLELARAPEQFNPANPADFLKTTYQLFRLFDRANFKAKQVRQFADMLHKEIQRQSENNLPPNYHLWMYMAAYATNSEMFASIQRLYDSFVDVDLRKILACYMALVRECNPVTDIRKVAFSLVKMLCFQYDTERMIPLDLWIFLGREGTGSPLCQLQNCFAIFEQKPDARVLTADPVQTARNSELLQRGDVQGYADAYLRDRNNDKSIQHVVKQWLKEAEKFGRSAKRPSKESEWRW